jgi:hypothetical protein
MLWNLLLQGTQDPLQLMIKHIISIADDFAWKEISHLIMCF